MEPNLVFEEIKKVYYNKGATDALDDINMMSEGGKAIIIKEKFMDALYKKYKVSNILSGEELDEAQQKSE